MATTRDLYSNLIWPAAAGNITWFFIYLAIEKGFTAEVRTGLNEWRFLEKVEIGGG